MYVRGLLKSESRIPCRAIKTGDIARGKLGWFRVKPPKGASNRAAPDIVAGVIRGKEGTRLLVDGGWPNRITPGRCHRFSGSATSGRNIPHDDGAARDARLHACRPQLGPGITLNYWRASFASCQQARNTMTFLRTVVWLEPTVSLQPF